LNPAFSSQDIYVFVAAYWTRDKVFEFRRTQFHLLSDEMRDIPTEFTRSERSFSGDDQSSLKIKTGMAIIRILDLHPQFLPGAIYFIGMERQSRFLGLFP